MTALKALSSAVRDACTKDKKGHIFCIHRQKIYMNKKEVCSLLRKPMPKSKNWSPDFNGMAAIMRELLSYNHEGVRRWAILALYTACRPDAITEFNRTMIESNWGKHIFKSARDEETAVIKPQDSEDYEAFLQADNKRRPTLPLPQMLYDEFMTWGDGLWVDIKAETVRNYIVRAREKLGMPELWPSTFRDFVPVAMRHVHVWLNGAEVSINEAEIWQGHAVASEQHMRYGFFDPDYLRTAAAAVEHYMQWLDRECDGKLFCRITGGSATAESASEEDDIAIDEGTEASAACRQAEPAAAAIKRQIQFVDSSLTTAQAEAHAPCMTWLAPPTEGCENAAEPFIQAKPTRHVADELSSGLRGKLAGLTGAKLLQKGQIEGFQGLFRRVSDGSERGIWTGEFQRSGSRHVLPNLASWFRVTGIEIYEMEVASPDKAVRMFVDQASQTVIDVSEVKVRMLASLGRDPGGWASHSSLSKADGCKLGSGPFEYRDLNEPHDPPRGLLELVAPHSPLGTVTGVPRWFKEVFVSEHGDLAKSEKLDWRFMLRNLQAFFDLNHIRIYEAEFIIGMQLKPLRIFADGLTEKTIPVEHIRQEMFDQLGCDPGGWAEHSSFGGSSTFDVEAFISTTSMKDELDRLYVDGDDFDPTEGTDIMGWH
ncbi:hypothetical protein LPLAFNJD_LOCUS1937 [Methylorubrum aminovorans]